MMTPRDPYVVSMSKLIEPYGKSKNDFEIFKGIARKMGVENKFTEGRSQEEWQKWIYKQTFEKALAANIKIPSYEKFRKDKWFKIQDPDKPTLMLKDFRDDPIKNALQTPSGKIEIFSQTVADFGYDDCPGHPVWIEPCEWLGKVDKKYPLHLISNQPKNKLHSQMDHGKYSKSFKIEDREPVEINPFDAEDRDLKNGDIVKLFNDRGSCLAGVVIDEKVMRGVVKISTGAWYDPENPDKTGSMCKHGNPNVLTRDKGTSKLGQGPIAHSCLIEMKKYKNKLPKVTAHEPPIIIRSNILLN
jgi:biotin/methionine sulfoxide reductase